MNLPPALREKVTEIAMLQTSTKENLEIRVAMVEEMKVLER